MQKVKKIIGYVAQGIIDIFSMVVNLMLAVIVPYSAVMLIGRVYDDIRHLPLDQRIIMFVLLLWICDLIIRPIVKNIMSVTINKFKKVWMFDPLESQEEIDHARCAATTAKDA